MIREALWMLATHTKVGGPFNDECASSTFFGMPHWARRLHFDGPSSCNIVDFKLMDVWVVVGNVVEMALHVAGYLAIIFILLGGFLFITSAGSPENIKRAKSTLLYAVIGLLVAVLGVTIIRFITGIF